MMSKNTNECVILLHGLARSSRSLSKLKNSLSSEGYHVINVDYPSRSKSIEYLSDNYIKSTLNDRMAQQADRVHFVTHSMGGILIRHYLANNAQDKPGNVVMLSPPNKGSEVVDKLHKFPGFFALNGPAGMQLGTGDHSLPNTIGPANFPLGIITGNKSINLILSLLISGINDGKVSVENARLDGMNDFLVVPNAHPFIINNKNVIKQVKFFLQFGKFEHKHTDEL